MSVNHSIIAIATEFGQIKVFEVLQDPEEEDGKIVMHSTFQEFFSGNIQTNICKLELFISEVAQAGIQSADE